MTKAYRVNRKIASLALLSTLVIAGCSSTDPNANLPAAAKTTAGAEQGAMYTVSSAGPAMSISAGQNNGSYLNARRSLVNGKLPDRQSIQLNDWVNFFPYSYPQPQGRIPFSASSEIANTPWNSETKLLRVVVKADDIQAAERRSANIVVLVNPDDTDLSLVRLSLTKLVNQLTPQDSLAILTYAGDNGILLAPTPGSSKDKMLSAIDNIKSGRAGKGSESRLAQAYQLAKEHYVANGVNRVILAGGSGFNAGFKNVMQAQSFFSDAQTADISLTTLGFAVNRFAPSALAELATIGHGVYGYIDNERDAEKTWAEQLRSTQTPVAKNFLMTVEFNPSFVKAYRLLGYQPTNATDEGQGVVVTGQALTALYEVVPAGSNGGWEGETFTPNANTYLRPTQEMAMVHLRYQQPTEQSAPQRIELPVPSSQMSTSLMQSSKDFRFAAAVAAFAQQLKYNGAATGQFTLDDTLKLAKAGKDDDRFELRGEFIQLVEKAQEALPKNSPIKGQSQN
ncbi:vWA domain-containing protein [Leminorella grimontii]|uniref:vWA domain-containing protein n=1 Tax=Leminorella grimontii TaxID=82981 RepID=UPI0021C2D7BF|nr:von Willebrand factor type A domain-containing protein [Leminorella grimontii]